MERPAQNPATFPEPTRDSASAADGSTADGSKPQAGAPQAAAREPASFRDGDTRPLREPPSFLAERYRIAELLGEGGMGRVYRAFDEHLKRWVALKMLRPESSASAKRLLFEARSQARVDHANVCKVYEVGEFEGQPFVVMQYINGRPLHHAFPQMTLRQKLTAVQLVAEGVHVAHRQGLIHRDLKPSNIMVEQSETGELKPYVLDFGLARELAAPGVTTTGEVKGTPNYMSPEQVTGEIHTLDPRTDVYSLGATLYEVLSGRPMFSDTSGLGVLVKVLNEEPESLRRLDPGLPAEVEAIVMKCLEKSAQNRYLSAQDLADDLRRFLEGEPVRVRPPSAIQRLKRRLGKRKVAVLSTALVALVVLGIGILIFNHLQGKKLGEIADRFRQDVDFIEETLNAAYGAPLHEITEEKKKVRQRLAEIERRVADHGRAGRGPGNYALGQGYLALEELMLARKHLEIAWDSGFKEIQVAHSLGRVLGALYQQEMRRAERIEDPEARRVQREKLAAELRQPALKYLEIGKDMAVDSAALFEALIAFWEGRNDEALAKAQQATTQLAAPYEAIQLQGDIYAAVGAEKKRQEDFAAARAAFLLAEGAYDKAQGYGRSAPRAHLGQCALGQPMMEIESYSSGGQLEPYFDRARASCERALQIDPERPEGYQLLADLLWRMGEYQLLHGQDPRSTCEQAVVFAERALVLVPEDVLAHTSKGLANGAVGDWELLSGENPTHSYEQAVLALEGAIAVNPNHAPAHNGLAYVYTQRARYELLAGREPLRILDQALAAGKRAVELRPTFTYAWDNMGNAYLLKAQWEWQLGEDPSATLQAALDAFERAIATNPSYVYARVGLGQACRQLALFELEQSHDPSAALRRGEQAIQDNLKINPQQNDSYLVLGRLKTLEGRFQLLQKANPSVPFAQAEKHLKRAIELYAVDATGFQAMAELARWRAAWRLAQGQSARAEIALGQQQLERALALNPDRAELIAFAGELYLLQAEHDPDPQVRRSARDLARQAFASALEKNPALEHQYGPLRERAYRL